MPMPVPRRVGGFCGSAFRGGIGYILREGTLSPAKDLVIDMESLHIVGGRRPNGTVHISGMKKRGASHSFCLRAQQRDLRVAQCPPCPGRGNNHQHPHADGRGGSLPYSYDAGSQRLRLPPCTSPDRLVESIRASSYLMGVELTLCGRTRISHTGGCRLGTRPLDYHTRAFELMGTEIDVRGHITGVAENGLHAAKIMLDTASVGATVNIMLAASPIAGGGDHHSRMQPVSRISWIWANSLPPAVLA